MPATILALLQRHGLRSASSLLTLAGAVSLAGCAGLGADTSATSAPTPEAAPQSAPCPGGTPERVRCLRGTDSAGAPYLIAMPERWTGVLVVHAHGGPTLGQPKASRADEDIDRWSITLDLGHAWAASVYRQGGVAVHSAAEDTERVRRIFVEHVARPKRTLLHGQSWGGGVAAVAAEMFPRSWDGVLLTSGVIGGGTRSYGFRLDLRVVYQALCHNHPLPDEPAYPLWSGLPAGSTLTRDALRQRIDDCLGLDREASQRTPEQARRLRTIVDVIRIPASSVQAHMAWATWHFQDIALHRSGGGNPFGNDKVRYRGSDDDAALDAAVLRYPVDPAARARFGADTDPTGRIEVPVLTVHGIDDPTAFVELEDSFRRTMTEAGRGDRLVQTFVKRASHSYLGDATYPPAFEALLRWVETGEKPTPEGIAARCPVLSPQAPPKEACAYVPGYAPASLETRVPPR